ncbi:DNA-directed RNA polymerase I subunit RPA2 protein [Dioscorea alata]|uniref:DNA-directed RNA polymerase I subunit RPA2 protein n=1 Tax=Dioscorea alata TaxID=55571 RepID=A0ACB7TZC8_DIOAL|nr:DNA-directed RNA polymerase I subunit RPA2 protein [Dioscorea alata]
MAPMEKPDYSALRELVHPHIDSFDYFLDEGLEKAVSSIRPVELSDPVSGSKLRISFGKPYLNAPMKEGRLKSSLYPHQCREAGLSYKGEFKVELNLQFDNKAVIRDHISFGHLPIMLRSKLCHLRGASPEELIFHKEEATEMGGYFICNGLERLARLLIVPKRNYPIGMVRKSFRGRGDGYTSKGVVIRCVREDQSSVTIKLYYLQNGSARIGFWIRGREVLLPVGIILKALIDTNDHEIFLSLTSCYNEKYQRQKGAVGTQLAGERAQIILDEVRALSLLTRSQCLEHIGEFFQPAIYGFETEAHSVVAEAVLRDYIFVHLANNYDKFNLLIFMLQKLFALVDQTAAPDNPDALQNQEVLLPGHLITLYVKEKLEEWLHKSIRDIKDEMSKNPAEFEFHKLDAKKISRNSQSIGRAVESMIRTGKVATRSTLDLPQKDGMTIQAERLNFLRFISHFCAVHRGAAFAKMRTTSVRKLLPESWGFLCPVHTPDGEPCGLLNHMASSCRVTSFYDSDGKIKDFLKIRMTILTVLVGMGMASSLPKLEQTGPPEVLHVLLDGCVVGSISSSNIEDAVGHLRRLKLSASSGFPADLEVGHVPLSLGGAYPGLYLFTSPSRFVRPVRNIYQLSDVNHCVELIGPFEQAFMEIKCPDGGEGGRREGFPATHEEIHPTGILSVVANLTPWSDHNQSPRNMYQCQMAKQTMGFSAQAIGKRADVKLYHLQTPQSPIVRTSSYSKYCIDEFPTGTNAIVAVLAYTGYDMEDAMILNKSSVERGLCRGQIYQTETVDLTKKHDKSTRVVEIFARSSDRKMSSSIDSDGLPYVGQKVQPNDPYYSSYNTLTSDIKPTNMKSSEPAIIDFVSVDGTNLKNGIQKANIRFRRPRNPVIGDKFSSRHGQKGVCSQLWPDIDMPFSAITGMRPDLIINPHAFPSRMTIGMLLESVAAKGGCLKGQFMDATPFSNSVNKADDNTSFESSSLVDELGPMLTSYGFNYHGVEVLYSGVFGIEMTCEIFIGPVYYQRLRHMVSDKFQVRSTGVVDQVTRQPIGGRKRGGGIRFGEMERDSLLAHGAAYLLHDRLHSSSDFHIAEVCSICGSLLTTSTLQPQKRIVREIRGLPPAKAPKTFTCLNCRSSKGIETVAMPYVFRYLAAELASMNIRMDLRLSNQQEK